MTRRGARHGAPRAHVHPEWTELAECTQLPPEELNIFYPEARETAEHAKAICAVCPVDKAVCIAYGDRVSRDFGVFGGLTVTERRRRREANAEGRCAA